MPLHLLFYRLRQDLFKIIGIALMDESYRPISTNYEHCWRCRYPVFIGDAPAIERKAVIESPAPYTLRSLCAIISGIDFHEHHATAIQIGKRNGYAGSIRKRPR